MIVVADVDATNTPTEMYNQGSEIDVLAGVFGILGLV
jgi:hypothetical protein